MTDNVKALVELTAKKRPDIALADLRLPEMNGVEAIAEITRFDPGIRSITISTFDHEHLIVKAQEAGALGYLSKNSDVEEIIEALLTVRQGHPYRTRGGAPSSKNALRSKAVFQHSDIKEYGIYLLFTELLRDELASLEKVFEPAVLQHLLIAALFR